LLDAEAALARQKKPRRGDPGRTIAEALWPRSKQESGLRQRIAELTGAGPTHAGLELFILRDHAFEAAHFARFKKFPQDTGFGIRVYGLVDARMNRVLSEPRVMHWVSARSLVYWEAIASVTSASTAEQLAEMQRQIGAVFEQAFEQSGTALALIGAAEYDSAFTRFVEVCEQVTGE